jgi:hypothetical protein
MKPVASLFVLCALLGCDNPSTPIRTSSPSPPMPPQSFADSPVQQQPTVQQPIQKFEQPNSQVMTEPYRQAVTDHMVKQGSDRTEADAFTKALNDAQRDWEKNK